MVCDTTLRVVVLSSALSLPWVGGPGGIVSRKIADESFEAERSRVKEADALAQVFRISGDLVQSRLLISQVPHKFCHLADWC